MRPSLSRVAGAGAILLAVAVFLAPALPAQAVADRYPPSQRMDAVDTVAGHAVPDPYAWLEDQAAPRVRAWIESQNRYSTAVLDGLPDLDRIREAVREMALREDVGRPTWRDGKLYYMKRPEGAEREAFYVRDGLRGDERVLLDPAEVSPDPTVTVDFESFYGEGRYLVYSVRQGGEDETSLHIRDLETGRDLTDSFPRAYYQGVSFDEDESGFYYSRYHDRRPGQVLFHELGTEPSEDTVVYAADRREERVRAREVADGRYLLLTVNHGWRRTDVYLKDLEEGGGWRPIVEGLDARSRARWREGEVWLLTEHGAPRGRLVAVDPERPGPEHWREILPESGRVLDGYTTAAGRLWARYLTPDLGTHVAMYDMEGDHVRDLELPGKGNASLPWGGPDGKVFFRYESFTMPRHVFLYDPETTERTVWLAEDPPVETEDWTVDLQWYRSKDGVAVPVHVLHRADVERDGEHPTLLYGYGGFDVAQLPSFRERAALWVEAGGVFALAHIRGGGEFGLRWHRQGMLEFKQNAFNDFIAAAEHLVGRGYTRPEKLAVRGASNGGLLVGAVLTQRPELFGAAVADVPELDLVGYPRYDQINPPALEEYGDATVPEEFEWIVDWSPLQNVREGTEYPAVLMSSGAMDSRVDPVQALKMTAALQWATASDPAEEPVLLLYGDRVGHSGGRTPTESAEFLSRQLAFLNWQLGGPW